MPVVRPAKKRQDVEDQLIILREAVKRHKGWQVVAELVNYESGCKGRADRKQFDAMLKAASQKELDLLYFWQLDRLSREGIKKTIHYLELLAGWQVRFKSHTEEYLDIDNELIRHMLLGVLSYFAQQEAVKVSENTKVGLQRAKAKGKRLGRPPLSDFFHPPIMTAQTSIITTLSYFK